MHRVAITVDSGLDLPSALREKYGITQIPVHVNWRGRQYRDKVDLEVDDLFAQGEGSKDFPTTSQPSPGEFAAVFRELAKEAETIVSWHIASALSGTWASAQEGAKMVAKDIHVIDTRSVSMGGGLQALGAAKVLHDGGSLEQALAMGLAIRDKIQVRVVLDTLDYVLRGGRISRLEATVGSLLQIKPMLSIQNGVMSSAGRTRSRKRSLELLLNTVTAACSKPEGRGFVAAVGHACASGDIEYILAHLRRELPLATVIPYQVGIGIGAHGGPGVLGACYYNED